MEREDPLNDYSTIATERSSPLFAPDIALRNYELRNMLVGARILVVGGAGSIGTATIHQLIQFEPKSLHVVDTSENNLVELVRDLRGSAAPLKVGDFRTLPIDYGSTACERYLREQPPFDLVLNFAALKHVRSEKDVYSLLQMIDTNILKQARFLKWLAKYGSNRRYFSVSTDKAANPVNLMGATKRLMEHVMFSSGFPGIVSSARFANVAFSDGSLLAGWIHRFAKGQPIAVPRDTKRFFVSLVEAGQICLIGSAVAGQDQIVVPSFEPVGDLHELAPIAERFVKAQGLTPALYDDEETAKRSVASELARGHYPILLTVLDTSGEKAFEEFVGEGERTASLNLPHLEAVYYRSVDPAQPDALSEFLHIAQQWLSDASMPVCKHDIVHAISKIVPQFHHIETDKTLDSRL